MKRREIYIASPSTGDEEWLALRDTLNSGWLTQGPKVAEFEKIFAAKHQVTHALATTSCTTALHLILVALDIGPGDEVLVPAFTWIATANVVLYCGAKPVFVDIDPLTYNMDPTQLKSKITTKTKAIIAVHLFGLCADIDAIKAAAPDIPIIEDAACAAGSFYKGKPAGTLGVAAAFSFHPRKSITTGEGGMVTTNDALLADKMNCLRNHGASISEEQRHHGSKPYLLPEFNMLGFNYRMTDLQASVGIVQLEKLEKFVDERQAWASFYCDLLKYIPWLRTPTAPDHYKHAWQAFVCQIDKNAPITRNEIMELLLQQGIQTRPGTHAVVGLQYYQQKMQINLQDFPNALCAEKYSLAIPLHNRMTEEDYQYVANCMKNIVSELSLT